MVADETADGYVPGQMARQLFIHVGTHKTGTTSLQYYLADHLESLRRDGLGVVTESRSTGAIHTNCSKLADAVLRPSLVTGARSRDEFPTRHRRREFVALLRRLRSDVRRLDTSRLLISSEALCFARTRAEQARMRLVVEACRADATVILCVRDVDDWRASWDDQLAKDDYPRSYSPAPQDDIRSDWYYDLDAITRFWSRVGALQVIRYEDAVEREGSTIPAILEATHTAWAGAGRVYDLNQRRGPDWTVPGPRPVRPTAERDTGPG